MKNKDDTDIGGKVYSGVNVALLRQVPADSVQILDVGCGTGALAKRIKTGRQCFIVGITHSHQEAVLARQCLDEVFVVDLNHFDPHPFSLFDCIICSHVLEHLYKPEDVLRSMLPLLRDGGTLIVALPNVLHWRQRLEFLGGRFRYQDFGLLDRTHFRFFDWVTARQLVECAGYRVTQHLADGHFPLPLLRKWTGMAEFVDRLALRALPGLFGWQIILIAEKRP